MTTVIQLQPATKVYHGVLKKILISLSSGSCNRVGTFFDFKV